MEIKKVINIPIYHSKVIIVFGDQEYLNSLIKNDYDFYYESFLEYCPLNMNTTAALTINTGCDVIIYSDRIPSINTMLHEIFHAVCFLCENIVIPYSENNEPQAYLFEYISKEVLDWYKIKSKTPTEKDLIF